MGSDIIIGWVAADQSATIIVSLIYVLLYYVLCIFPSTSNNLKQKLMIMVFNFLGCTRKSVWASHQRSVTRLSDNIRLSIPQRNRS